MNGNLQLHDFSHIETTLGFERADLPLPSGVEIAVFLTELDSGRHGKIYGVFDGPWHAHQSDADDRAICTISAGCLPPCLQAMAARNSAKLAGAIECVYQTDSEAGSVVAASWKHACDWLKSEIPQSAIDDGAWGWIESPNDEEGRFYVAKENMA